MKSSPIHHLKRRAKALRREAGLPLHAALDRIATEEGYRSWGLLAARRRDATLAGPLFAGLDPGDLLLLAARPRQGKTLLGLELALEAARAGRRALFLSLEETSRNLAERLRLLAGDVTALANAVECDCSDAISADYILMRLAEAGRGTLAVIDYLQLLDQRRTNPSLDAQLCTLKGFARETGVILVFLSQVDRAFEASQRPLPGFKNVRLPNPLDLGLFDKACFLHAGRMRLAPAA